MFYSLALAGLVGGAWGSRLHSGGFINVVLPAYAGLAVVFAIAVHDGAEWSAASRSVRCRRWLPVAIHAVSLLQIVRLAYWPAVLVPTKEDLTTGHSVVAQLTAMPGDVFAPHHGYLAAKAGKRSYANAIAIWDVLRAANTPSSQHLIGEINRAVRSGRFDSLVLLDPATDERTWLAIESNYVGAERVVTQRSRFWLPAQRYLRKEPADTQ